MVACNAEGSSYAVTPCEFGCSEASGGCNECAPNSVVCAGSELNRCGSDGLPASSETCALSCVNEPNPHCAYLEPKYLPDICDVLANQETLVISSSGTFDTNLNSNCNGGVVTQAGGPEICVVRYGTITIEDGMSLTVTGARVLALVADRALLMAGYLDLSAKGSENGPGGGSFLSGTLGTTPDGGGGAGFATPGGHGGSATTHGGASNGGAASVDPAALTALFGGPRTGIDTITTGGGGGGATLVSCRGTVAISGEINAAGGGAAGGTYLLVAPLGGSGGGAGGHVVMQGVAITVTGKLFANGGGGGAGMRSDGTPGNQGEDGTRGLTAAQGGMAQSGEGGGGGGGGGVAGSVPGIGLRLQTAGTSAGGGGGSNGFFQSYTPAGVEATLTPSQASPVPKPNGTVPTR